MDINTFQGFLYLAEKLKLDEYELNKFKDIICNHEYEDYNDGYGNIYDKCKIFGRKDVKKVDTD